MTRRTRQGAGLGLVVVVVLVGLTLRGPVVGVPPVLDRIREDLSIGPATAGLVTALPLLAFALLSPFVSGLVARLGVDRALLASLVLLTAAIGLRPWTGVAGLLIATAAIGVAITIGNVVVPVLVRRDAGAHVPQVMAASVGAYGLGQTMVVYLAVPVAVVAGWRWAIMLPGVLALTALAAWAARMHAVGRRPGGPQPAPPPAVGRGHVWRQRGAWWLALFFGIQALLFYSTSTWAPAQLTATAGLSQQTAGTALSVFHLIGVAGTFLVPAFLRWTGDARRVGAGVAVGWGVYFVGLYLLPSAWAVWMVIGGVVQGAGIGLGLTLIAVRPVDAAYGRHLSGMVQGVGYALAAVGPVVLGWVAEVTRGWDAPTLLLVACAGLMLVASRFAGDRVPIGGRR